MEKLKGHRKELIISMSVLLFFFAVFAFVNQDIFNCFTNSLIYVLAFICCTAILFLFFILVFVKEYPMHRVFLMVGGAAAFLSLLINSPGSIPDEYSHIENTYFWSNRVLGISEAMPDNQTYDVYKTYDSYMRREDTEVMGKVVAKQTSTKAYEDIIRNFHFRISLESATLIPHQFTDLGVSPTAYFPAILGVTIARLLNLGCVPMLYFGKFFMTVFYVFAIYWAIKRIPIGKTTMFIISMFPMCMHLAPSFSYDSVIIAFSMMLIAQIMYLAYGDIHRIGIKEALISGILVFLFSPLKIMAYFPVFALFFIIPKSKFSKTGRYFIFNISMLVLGIAGIIIANLSMARKIDPTNTMVNQYISSGRPAYTIDWILHHPLDTVEIIVNTTVRNFTSYYNMMIGGSLGWMCIPVWDVLIGGIGLCTLASCIGEQGMDPIPITKKQRWSFAVVTLFVYIFFLIGMMVWWTPFGEDVIEGIQGRYFIPVLPLLMFVFMGRKFIEVRKNFHQAVALSAVVLSLAAYSNILVKILSLPS